MTDQPVYVEIRTDATGAVVGSRTTTEDGRVVGSSGYVAECDGDACTDLEHRVGCVLFEGPPTSALIATELIRIASAGGRITLTAQSTADLEATAARIAASPAGVAIGLGLCDVEADR